MTLLRTPASYLAFGMLCLIGNPAGADDDYGGAGARLTSTASHCASYGVGFVDVGNGTCAKVGNHVLDSHVLDSHVRVDLGVRQAATDGWGGRDGTSSAELRSQGSEFMPGVGTSHQLRVRSGLQTLNPF